MSIPMIGQPRDRVDGRAKVTGAARFAAENNPGGIVHAVSSRPGIHWLDRVSAKPANFRQQLGRELAAFLAVVVE